MVRLLKEILEMLLLVGFRDASVLFWLCRMKRIKKGVEDTIFYVLLRLCGWLWKTLFFSVMLSRDIYPVAWDFLEYKWDPWRTTNIYGCHLAVLTSTWRNGKQSVPQIFGWSRGWSSNPRHNVSPSILHAWFEKRLTAMRLREPDIFSWCLNSFLPLKILNIGWPGTEQNKQSIK